MLLDYHVHAVAHGEYCYNQPWLNEYIDMARKRGLYEIGFVEHDEFLKDIDFSVLEELKRNEKGMRVKNGLEIDYIPGREAEIRDMLKRHNFDYTIGSIHFIDGWAFDHPDYKDKFDGQDIDKIYKRYFTLVNQAVNSGLFNIIGHIDLVKKWGHRPLEKDVSYYIKTLMHSIKRSGCAVEINSAGLRKPIGENYPSLEIIKIMFEMGIPITLASDAHHPSETGMGVRNAADLAQSIGYRMLASFSNGTMQMVHL